MKLSIVSILLLAPTASGLVSDYLSDLSVPAAPTKVMKSYNPASNLKTANEGSVNLGSYLDSLPKAPASDTTSVDYSSNSMGSYLDALSAVPATTTYSTTEESFENLEVDELKEKIEILREQIEAEKSALAEGVNELDVETTTSTDAENISLRQEILLLREQIETQNSAVVDGLNDVIGLLLLQHKLLKQLNLVKLK